MQTTSEYYENVLMLAIVRGYFMQNKLNIFEKLYLILRYSGAFIIVVFALHELYQISYLLASVYLIFYYFGMSILIAFFTSSFTDTSSTPALSSQDFLIAKNTVWSNRLIDIPIELFIMYFFLLSFEYGLFIVLAYIYYNISDTDTRFQASSINEVYPNISDLRQRIKRLESENKELKKTIENLSE